MTVHCNIMSDCNRILTELVQHFLLKNCLQQKYVPVANNLYDHNLPLEISTLCNFFRHHDTRVTTLYCKLFIRFGNSAKVC